ncbi:S-layer domain protein [Veillonella parvula DSM 2008]|uniref:S-layer homology domain-containing protein n=1 Tax=Veillonella parvula TaxID=29466 RepID=UPI00019C0318|nr:S-layer homology domain-containing protein [Veillonella parvula]ACZ23730.1 S-layer domain protein [Veillonella parvula DSM 2008]QQB16983.1 S-layer homology domain-containing protein [Veillonella parvula]SNU93566.1 Adhesin yadA precursor [Veillonella parvula]
MSKRKLILSVLINGVLLSSLYVAGAVDVTPGNGNGVAIGTGSSAPKAENVAVGKGAGISYSNGASEATGDVAIGNGAGINNYASQGGSIAIGKNAKVENMAGGGEASFALGQTTYSGGFFSSARIPADPTKVVGSVAIGDNTFARTGSTMIGSHNYKGDLGDTTVDSASTRKDALNVYTTTIGANSFSNGAFTTSTGVYNIISSDYNGGRAANSTKNFGATINGTLNSIESKTGSYYSGVANSIVGTANRTFNSNGSLVFGAGNEITNSVADISAPSSGGNSAKELSEKLRSAVKNSNGGGSTMAFGSGNKADYTLRSALMGVNNTLTGDQRNKSTNTMLTGFHNTADKVSNTTVIGSENTVTNSKNSLVMGDNREVKDANHAVLIGSTDSKTTTSVNNAVAVGHNTNVTVEGGVALGSESKATVAAGSVGYDPSTKAQSTNTDSTWKATKSAVSVGDANNNITRQITSVAAGTKDTDAVNVAQLKKLQNQVNANGSTTVSAGKHINVTTTTNGTTKDYKVSLSDDITNQITNNTTNINNIQGDVTNIKQNVTNIQGDITNIKQDVTNMGRNVARLDKKVNKSVAGVAALAALHPLDFDPDAKWDFAAGYGHYHDGNAAALGAFYRPNEDLQFSVGSTVGNGETVVNAGMSVKVGAHSNVSRSRVAIGKEVLELKKTVAVQNAQIQKLTALLNGLAGTNMKADRSTLFPDVPNNHWAYAAVSDLSRRGLVEGYPDGTFGGDRMLTRYEFAQIVYRAIQNGVVVDDRLVSEFGPEMALFRVDTIAKNHEGQPTIERVRVNKK